MWRRSHPSLVSAVVRQRSALYTRVMANEEKYGHPTSVRLEKGIRDRLETFAQKDHRTITSAVNYLLDKALSNEEKHMDPHAEL